LSHLYITFKKKRSFYQDRLGTNIRKSTQKEYRCLAGADERVYKTLKDYSIATCCPRTELGTAPVHVELERTIADFVGKPAAIVVGMGFATNSTLIPCLLGAENATFFAMPFIHNMYHFTKTGSGQT
jgi:serine palmitoyltransferase